MRRRPIVFAFVLAPLTRSYFATNPTHFSHSLEGNLIGDEGASALAAVLKETQITNLKCAASLECSLFCQRPLTALSTRPCSHARSLSGNILGSEGGAALAEGLKGNTMLKWLR